MKYCKSIRNLNDNLTNKLSAINYNDSSKFTKHNNYSAVFEFRVYNYTYAVRESNYANSNRFYFC